MFAAADERAPSFSSLSSFLSCVYSFFRASLTLCFLSVMFKTKGAVNLVSNYADLLWADLKTTTRRLIFGIVAPTFDQIMQLLSNFSFC